VKTWLLTILRSQVSFGVKNNKVHVLLITRMSHVLFIFIVLAPAQIGTTVTAYHHKAHLLHRGTVLAHDSGAEAYLIQFEKKALGYEWCADFEVASHGLPEVIFPPREELQDSDAILTISPCGVLPSGTNYGPLIGKFSFWMIPIDTTIPSPVTFTQYQ